MTTMDALMVEETGKPVVLRKRPIPTPGEGEILIKVTVAARQSELALEKSLKVELSNIPPAS